MPLASLHLLALADDTVSVGQGDIMRRSSTHCRNGSPARRFISTPAPEFSHAAATRRCTASLCAAHLSVSRNEPDRRGLRVISAVLRCWRAVRDAHARHCAAC